MKLLPGGEIAGEIAGDVALAAGRVMCLALVVVKIGRANGWVWCGEVRVGGGMVVIHGRSWPRDHIGSLDSDWWYASLP